MASFHISFATLPKAISSTFGTEWIRSMYSPAYSVPDAERPGL